MESVDFLGVCTKTCGGGVKKRKREEAVKDTHGGEPCVGETKDTEACETQKCPIRKLYVQVVFQWN